MKKAVGILALLLLLSFGLTGCGLTVPRPEIKEGKFDFSITYELNGEEKTFSSVYVCEYDGTSWSAEGFNYTRDWEDRTEGKHEGDDYCAIIGKTEDGGDIVLFFGIYPEYFMGDSTGDRGVPVPSLYITYPEDEDGGYRHIGEADVIEESYGAKIIGYEYDAPVENTFGLFK